MGGNTTARSERRLTARSVAALNEPGRYGDGLGLWLQVTPTGVKSWLFLFMRDGKARQMGLGPLHTVSLADARQRAAEARKLLLDGFDPIDARNATRARAQIDAAKGVTFEECAARYIKAHNAAWKNAKHAA